MPPLPAPPQHTTRSRPLSAAAGAVLLAGCSIVNPVPDAMLAGRLSPSVSTDTAPTSAAAASPAGAAAACAGQAGFVGGLDVAICNVDARRLAYLRSSADVLNGTATYNAMLWPLGAVAVHEVLRGAPNAKLLLPATLGAAAYGFMNAGIPERQQNYLNASRQLACAIVAAGPDLYLRQEIEPATGAPQQSPPALRAALVQLSFHIDAYDRARTSLLIEARPRPGTAAVAAPVADNVFDRARQRSGSGRAATQGLDKRKQLAQETQDRLTLARDQLALGQALLRRLTGGAAAASLLVRAAQVDAQLQERLSVKAPPPANPASVAGDVKGLTQAMLKLQASIDGAVAPAATNPLDSVLPAEISDGLDTDSQRLLQDFQKNHAADLRRTTQQVSDWLARHRAGQTDAAALLSQAGCADAGAITTVATTATPTTTPPDATAAGRGSRPATGVTGNGSNASNSNPPSGTTLPRQ